MSSGSVPELSKQQAEQLQSIGCRLRFEQGSLQLQAPAWGRQPLRIDFVEGKSRHRRLYGGGRGQPLARAIGIRGDALPDVLDVTAGMGRDAFVLASLGCKVTMLERSEVIALLLADALKRAMADADTADITQRMQLQHLDASEYLQDLSVAQYPAVIYLDPMYPHRDKSALVKKEMRLFRELVGDDVDSASVLGLARQRAIRRVVVKRPISADWLGQQQPHSQIASKNTRYDIYLPAGM